MELVFERVRRHGILQTELVPTPREGQDPVEPAEVLVEGGHPRNLPWPPWLLAASDARDGHRNRRFAPRPAEATLPETGPRPPPRSDGPPPSRRMYAPT